MANRYWIGGSGTWDDTAHWSSTSGGTGGASVPTSADNVYFDANSGSATITTVASMECKTLLVGTFTGGFSGNGSLTLTTLTFVDPWPNSNYFSLDAITLSASSITLSVSNSTFDMGSATVTTGTFYSTNTIVGGTSSLTVTGTSFAAFNKTFNNLTFTNSLTIAQGFSANLLSIVSSGKTVTFNGTDVNVDDLIAVSTGAQTVLNFSTINLAPTGISSCTNVSLNSGRIAVSGLSSKYLVCTNCTVGSSLTRSGKIVFNNNAGAIALF